ncbi:hypothetical protein [Devosia crocina]|nr:hypothetical protein [Devosia crocina]
MAFESGAGPSRPLAQGHFSDPVVLAHCPAGIAEGDTFEEANGL